MDTFLQEKYIVDGSLYGDSNGLKDKSPNTQLNINSLFLTIIASQCTWLTVALILALLQALVDKVAKKITAQM
jgi:hypothetical protein